MLSQKAELGISNSSCAFIVLSINQSFKKIPERFFSVFTSEGFAQNHCAVGGPDKKSQKERKCKGRETGREGWGRIINVLEKKSFLMEKQYNLERGERVIHKNPQTFKQFWILHGRCGWQESWDLHNQMNPCKPPLCRSHRPTWRASGVCGWFSLHGRESLWLYLAGCVC